MSNFLKVLVKTRASNQSYNTYSYKDITSMFKDIEIVKLPFEERDEKGNEYINRGCQIKVKIQNTRYSNDRVKKTLFSPHRVAMNDVSLVIIESFENVDGEKVVINETYDIKEVIENKSSYSRINKPIIFFGWNPENKSNDKNLELSDIEVTMKVKESITNETYEKFIDQIYKTYDYSKKMDRLLELSKMYLLRNSEIDLDTKNENIRLNKVSFGSIGRNGIYYNRLDDDLRYAGDWFDETKNNIDYEIDDYTLDEKEISLPISNIGGNDHLVESMRSILKYMEDIHNGLDKDLYRIIRSDKDDGLKDFLLNMIEEKETQE